MCSTSVFQILHCGTSIIDHLGWPRENSSHPWVLECISSTRGSWWLLKIVTTRPQTKLLYWGGNDQQILVFVFHSKQWVDTSHHIPSSSSWGSGFGGSFYDSSVKSTVFFARGGTTWLGRLVWGHWFVAPRLTAPKPWRMSQLVNMTCSHTASLSSTTPPTKGQKSGISSRLSSSTQYCSPLA